MQALLQRLLGRRKRSEAIGDYRPRRNGRPDPGEICWAWVPFEDDPAQGKDRPVLIIGQRGRDWLALMLTSKDHDHDAVRQRPDGVAIDRFGRHWLDVGAGSWDRLGRPSEVRLDRLLSLNSVRREGSALDERTYQSVIAAGSPLWESQASRVDWHRQS